MDNSQSQETKEVTASLKEAKQRFHDYFIQLYRDGKLTGEDMPQYQQAMTMERLGEVKPLK